MYLKKLASILAPSLQFIVLVLLVRPDLNGADRLQALKFERGQQNPCWQCSFADPVCSQAGNASFVLPLPVSLLFENAPTPAALAGKSHVELDLFAWKSFFSWSCLTRAILLRAIYVAMILGTTFLFSPAASRPNTEQGARSSDPRCCCNFAIRHRQQHPLPKRPSANDCIAGSH
jgi:hypothetical protein